VKLSHSCVSGVRSVTIFVRFALVAVVSWLDCMPEFGGVFGVAL